LKFDILFENKFLLVIDKPAGFLSVPSRWGAQDARPCLGTLLQKELGVQIFPLHRLDEETSGVIAYAKDKSLHKILNQAFENHQVQKIYQAISENPSRLAPISAGTLMKDKILRGKKRSYISPVGQNAETKILACSYYKDQFLSWELQPLTGRSHQLRFQLSSRNFPILADKLYGAQTDQLETFYLPSESLKEHSIALRSQSLNFEPISKQIAAFEIPTFFQVSHKLEK
jgi:tRNA pseudouridine32 synthase/23S rRNA pseudouridine746 synthase